MPLSYLALPLIYSLSLHFCLFWTFWINGIIEYVAFCVTRLSLSRFIQYVDWINTPFYNWVIFHYLDRQHFIYLLINLMDIWGFFPTFWVFWIMLLWTFIYKFWYESYDKPALAINYVFFSLFSAFIYTYRNERFIWWRSWGFTEMVFKPLYW